MAPAVRKIEFMRVSDRLHDEGYSFVLNEIQAGIMFTRLGRQSDDPETRERCSGRARIAYDTCYKFFERLPLSIQQSTQIEGGLKELQARLLQLAESA